MRHMAENFVKLIGAKGHIIRIYFTFLMFIEYNGEFNIVLLGCLMTVRPYLAAPLKTSFSAPWKVRRQIHNMSCVM